MNRALLLASILLLGCSAEPEPAPVPAEPAQVAAPLPPPVAFGDAAIQCCSGERVRRVVEEYLDLQQALGHDDLALSQAQLQTLRAVALVAAEDVDISAHSRGLSQQVAGLLEPVAEGDLDKLRDAFALVSNKLIVLVQANQGGSKPVAVAFCAKTNANWLQADPELLNPFLGSLDPSSGSFRP